MSLDKEIEVLSACDALLSDLEPDSRTAVIAFLARSPAPRARVPSPVTPALDLSAAPLTERVLEALQTLGGEASITQIANEMKEASKDIGDTLSLLFRTGRVDRTGRSVYRRAK